MMALKLLLSKSLPIKIISCSPCFRRDMGFFGKTKVRESPFIILRATPKDTCDILDLMWDAYYPDEPTTASIGLGRTRNSIFDEKALKIISKGYSIIARCKYNGCLSGAVLNDVTCPWDPQQMEKFACSLQCKRMAQLYMFYAYLQKAPELWEKYQVPQIFEISMAFVKPDDRKKGLAKNLIEYARTLGADLGFKVIRVDATSSHSAEICNKLKFSKVLDIPYCSYVDDDNEPIFKPDPPHTTCSVYIDTPHCWNRK